MMDPVLIDATHMRIPARAEADDGTIGDGVDVITPDDPRWQEWLPFVRFPFGAEGR